VIVVARRRLLSLLPRTDRRAALSIMEPDNASESPD
jgi:hypothetical protein